MRCRLHDDYLLASLCGCSLVPAALLTKDVNEEFNKDHAAAFKALPAAEQKTITSRQQKRSAEVVKAHFAQIAAKP